MIIPSHYQLPEDKRDELRHSRFLAWLSLAYLVSVALLLYLVMGNSQAMKTVLLEDLLGLIPPVVYLLSLRFRDLPPNEEFPYGYRRVTLLSFLGASVAIFGVALFMLVDSVHVLLAGEHPTLGHIRVFGEDIWSGWAMLVVLAYGAVPPVILGRKKLRIARELHEKTLHADALMNKADWLTAVAGMVGVIGIGLGIWWVDAAAAIFIAVDVLRDGYRSLRGAMEDLMDHRPSRLSDRGPLGIEQRLMEEACRVPGVRKAGLRLREEGHTITGEIFIELADPHGLAREIREVLERVARVDWRLHNLVVVPVEHIDEPSFAEDREWPEA